jgi:hypothetical protein
MERERKEAEEKVTRLALSRHSSAPLPVSWDNCSESRSPRSPIVTCWCPLRPIVHRGSNVHLSGSRFCQSGRRDQEEGA